MIDIAEITPFDMHKYANLSLNQLAVFAIDFMQREGIPITFENITIVLFKMFPKKFCLLGFEQYPDATRVNRTLLQLRPKYRNWALGDVKKGYVLTDKGKYEAGRTRDILMGSKAAPRGGKINNIYEARSRRPDEDLQRIEKSKLYMKYYENRLEEVQTIDFYDMLSAFPQTPIKAIKESLISLEKQARNLGRDDICNFIRWTKRRFAYLLDEKSSREGG